MTTSSLRYAFTTLLVIAALGVPAATAHEKKDKASPIAEAKSPEEAWEKSQSSLKAIREATAAKNFGAIHDEQEKLAASLKQLQEKGTSADKQRFEGAIRNAIAASDRVHVAADAKDVGRLESSLRTLEASMAMVEKHLALEK